MAQNTHPSKKPGHLPCGVRPDGGLLFWSEWRDLRAFFACGRREKSKNSPVCALAHAQATGLCDYTFKSRHSETKTGGVCPLLLFGRSGETCKHFSLAGDAKNQRIRQCVHWLMHRPPACAITHSSLATVKQKQGAFAPCFCLVGVARLELAASWSRTMRATSCATPRKAYSL